MAGNFTIAVLPANDHVCFKLNGDFDGSSACELLNLLTDYFDRSPRILVDTDSIGRVHPFGLHVLHNQLGEVKFRDGALIFIGKRSAQFSLG